MSLGRSVDSSAVDWSAFEHLDPTRPGLVAAAIRGGEVRSWRSFGAEQVGGPALTIDAPFYVASIAKQFTAAAIGLLVLEGALALDDPVREWVPELPGSWSAVQVHHLLAHTSGGADGNAVDRRAGFGAACTMTTAERVAVIASSVTEHPPGIVHRYSNHGYVLLAEIVERATGIPLGEFVCARIFDEVGMNRSAFVDVDGVRSVPGWVGGTRRVDVGFSCVGDGGLVTTNSDLARWDGWLPASPLAGLMLRERPRVRSGRLAHDAWGISLRTHRGRRIESHGGSIDGYLARHVRFPEQGWAFIVLANTDEYGISVFGTRTMVFVDQFLGDALDDSLPPWIHTHGI